MEKKIATIVSYLLHPLIMPTYLFIFLTGLNIHIASYLNQFRWNLILMVFISTFLLPALLVFILRNKGLVSSMHMPKRQERTFPFFITAIIYIIAYQLFKKMSIPIEFYMVVIGAALMIIITLVINLWWKISIHMVGIGGALGVITGLSATLPVPMLYPVIIMFFAAGILGAARLSLQTHKPSQIYTGFGLGYFSMLIFFGSLAG